MLRRKAAPKASFCCSFHRAIPSALERSGSKAKREPRGAEHPGRRLLDVVARMCERACPSVLRETTLPRTIPIPLKKVRLAQGGKKPNAGGRSLLASLHCSRSGSNLDVSCFFASAFPMLRRETHDATSMRLLWNSQRTPLVLVGANFIGRIV